MEISSRLKRKDIPVSNPVPKGMGKYFQETSKRAVHFAECWQEMGIKSWKGFWLWEAVDLLVMMGMDIGEWIKTKRAQETSEEGKPR